MAWKAQIFIIFILVAAVYNAEAEDQKNENTLENKNTINTQTNGTEQNNDPNMANVENGAANNKSNGGEEGKNNSTTTKDGPQDNKSNSNSSDAKNIFYFILLYPENINKPKQNATTSPPKNDTSSDKDPVDKKNGTEPQKDLKDKLNANNTNTQNVTKENKPENATKPKDNDEHHAGKSSYALRNSQPDDRLTSNQNKGTVAVRPKKDQENPTANKTKTNIPSSNKNTSSTQNVTKNNNTPVIIVNPNSPPLGYVAVRNVNPGQPYYRMANPSFYSVNGQIYAPVQIQNQQYVPVNTNNLGGTQRIPVLPTGTRLTPLNSSQPLQNKVLVLNNGQRYLLKDGQSVRGKKKTPCATRTC